MPQKKPQPRVAKAANLASGQFVMNTARAGTAASTVHFGTVSVNASSPKLVEFRRNVSTGQQALARAVPKIAKAGVVLSSSNSVPLFRADPQNPSRLIRELNGKIASGVFVGGKFKVSPAKR